MKRIMRTFFMIVYCLVSISADLFVCISLLATKKLYLTMQYVHKGLWAWTKGDTDGMNYYSECIDKVFE